ncbi:MAG TPA: polysaccharide biosynthesis/export family protein [Vicinamibacterales bacterium]|nr:polysaccharide biosynthesis/export family protein [Vicinamibacterales bacterium]
MALLTMLLAAAVAARAQQAPPEPLEAAYVIGPEDVLDVAVWGNTDVSRTMPVRPDGKISLPLLNDVQAAGLTPMQLGGVIAAGLERYIATPMVSVIVREVHSFKVTVIGEVKTPGRYELHSRTTVLDVLALAGGFSQYAARNRITILRRQGDAVRELPYDFEKITRAGSKAGQDNLCVLPGDIIVVP